jgi:hypothetical protein
MKTLLENWNRYLKEAVDARGIRLPDLALHSVGSYPNPTDMKLGKDLPSIGYSEIEKPKFVEDMKTIFSATEGNWVVIFMKNTYYFYKQLDTEHFKNWLASQSYPEDSKILVVASSPLQNDYTSPEWVVHDIIGHVVGKKFLITQKTSFDEDWLREPYRLELITNLLKFLNQNKQQYPISNAEVLFDAIYDIFASIALNHLSRQDALSVAESDQQKRLINKMFKFCNAWVASIPSDNTQVTIVQPL